MAAKEWWKFRRDHDLAHLTFHSTRVSVITRMARAGVTQQKAMRFVGHASATIHRVYQRLNAGDVADVTAALSFSKRGKP
jgi:integrase